MIKNRIKNIIAANSEFLAKVYNLFGRNRTRINGLGNVVDCKSTFMKKCKIIIHGSNNKLILNKKTDWGGYLID